MKHQFDVTLQHFEVTDGYAVAASGSVVLGKLNSLELLQVLMIFQETNPVQSFEAEPQVLILVKGEKYFVRTDLNRLMLYNSRKLHEPALVRDAQQIIMEIDDSAAKEREALLRRLNKAGGVATLSANSGIPEEQEKQGGVWKTSIPWLALVALALGGACVYYLQLELSPATQAAASCTPIKDGAEIIYRRDALAGLYLSGTNPGHHAIVLMSSGKIRFLQMNTSGPTSEIRDEFEMLSGDEGLYLRTSQPGGLIQVESKETLRYCGESYHRKY
jgi:hypothetical protein